METSEAAQPTQTTSSRPTEMPSFRQLRERTGRPGQGMTWLLRVRIVLMLVALAAVLWTIAKLK